MTHHTRDKSTKCLCMYTVYDVKSDLPIISYASAKECAKYLGITVKSFYTYLSRGSRKWDFYKQFIDED